MSKNDKSKEKKQTKDELMTFGLQFPNKSQKKVLTEKHKVKGRDRKVSPLKTEEEELNKTNKSNDYNSKKVKSSNNPLDKNPNNVPTRRKTEENGVKMPGDDKADGDAEDDGTVKNNGNDKYDKGCYEDGNYTQDYAQDYA